jgi:hypothetical protein
MTTRLHPRAPVPVALAVARRLLPGPVMDMAADVRLARRATHDAPVDEAALALQLLAGAGVERGYAVDIAACDGVTKSNSLALYRQGWEGLAIEGDPESFARLARVYRGLPRVGLVRAWVSPGNVADLLRAAGVPRAFDFLSLDIDGYDHHVLAAVLEEFSPRLVCAEINEKIPPPLAFSVRYDPGYAWREDDFFGQSLSMLHGLCAPRGYALVAVHYNNAFYLSRDLPLPADLEPGEAYRAGYLDRPDRLERFPWNASWEPVHGLSDAEKAAFVRERFAAYEGQYDLTP